MGGPASNRRPAADQSSGWPAACWRRWSARRWSGSGTASRLARTRNAVGPSTTSLRTARGVGATCKSVALGTRCAPTAIVSRDRDSACHSSSAPSLLVTNPNHYSPTFGEGLFSELRRHGVLGSSPTFQISLIWVIRLVTRVATVLALYKTATTQRGDSVSKKMTLLLASIVV